jgi:transposase
MSASTASKDVDLSVGAFFALRRAFFDARCHPKVFSLPPKGHTQDDPFDTKWVRKTFLTSGPLWDSLGPEGVMSEIELTATQRRRLRAALKDPPSTGFYRRALAVLALDGGQSAGEVAELLGVSRQSVYNWAQAYEQSPGPDALCDRYAGGRPTVWTPQRRALLEDCLRRRPDQLGYAGVNWTVPLLREHLRRCGCWLSDDTVRRQLGRLGYAWKRFRYVLPPDPELEKKTRHPPAAAGFAAAERQAGRGRDRAAAVPAAARRLGPARAARPGADQRGQRPARPVRHD